MKKFLSILLALLMMLSLVACGDNAAKTEDEEEKEEQEDETDEKDKNKDAEGDDEADDDKDDKDENNKVDKDEDKDADDKKEDNDKEDLTLSFSATTIIDNDDVTIKITDIEEDGDWGYTLKTEIKNKSSDTNYMISVDNATINGVVFDPFFATEVAAGKTAKEDICFFDDVIEKNIGSFTDIALTISVSDAEDWMADNLAEETVHIYPYGQENAKTFVRETKATDTVLFDNEYATFIITDYEYNEIWGYTANIFIENKTDKNLGFDAADVSVNDIMVDPYFYYSVPAGSSSFTSMIWFYSDFEEKGITDVEKIEFTMTVSDADDWYSGDFVNDTFVLNP